MSSDSICGIAIEYTLDPSGLLGAPWEYRPYIESYATFGAYRMLERDHLAPTADHRGTGDVTAPLPAALGEEKDVTQISVEHRLAQRYNSTRRLEFTLPHWQRQRYDDAIRFKLFAYTRFAGVPFLDKQESAHVERERPEGICVIELHDLFAHFARLCAADASLATREHVSFNVDDVFIDSKVLAEKIHSLVGGNGQQQLTIPLYNKYAPLAQATTTKASVQFRVTLSHFNHRAYAQSVFSQPKSSGNDKTELHAVLPLKQTNVSGAAEATWFRPLPYNSERAWAKMSTAIQSVVEVYCDAFVKMSAKHQPRVQASEPALENLHMPMYAAEEGNTVLDEYWSCSEPFFRQYHSAEARQEALETYALNEKTEAYFMLMLRSSLRRHGLSEASFARCIEHHFSPQNTSHTMDPLMLLCDEVVADVGTFVATSAYYTADYRLMNTETTTPSTTQSARRLVNLEAHHHPDPESHHHLSHRKRMAAAAPQCIRCGRAMTVKVLMLDSWDNHLLNGASMCDDCEGQAKTAKAVILQYSVGRYALQFRWQSPTLEAVRLYLSHTDVGSLGSLVTSAFMNTDNTKMELQQNDELPLIGSVMDRNAQNDGHCFDITFPLSRFVAQAERGNLPRDLVASMKKETFVSEAFQARERARGTLVLEGTGPTEPRLLDLETSYGAHSRTLFEKRRAEMACMKKMRALIKADKPRYERMATLFNGRGMAHYVKKQEPQRRISPFYRSPVHMINVALKRRFGNHPALTQVAFCKRDGDRFKRGVTMGELLRDEASVALISPYADTALKWQSEVLPTVETIENQMPVMRFSRYSDAEYEHEIYSIFVSRAEAASQHFEFGQLKAAEARGDKKRAEARTAFEKSVFAVEADDSTSLLRLYSRVWKLDKSREDRAQLMAFLDAMKPAIRDYAFYVERHMPNLEPVIEIMCLVDVAACLKFEAELVPTTTKSSGTSVSSVKNFDSMMPFNGKKKERDVQTQPRQAGTSSHGKRDREAVIKAQKLARRIEEAAAKLLQRKTMTNDAETRLLLEEVQTMSVEIAHELAQAESTSSEEESGNEKDPLVSREEDDDDETVLDPVGALEGLIDFLRDQVMEFFLLDEKEGQEEGKPNDDHSLFFDEVDATLDLVLVKVPSKIEEAFMDALNGILSDAKLFRDLFYRADRTTGARIRERVAAAIRSSGLTSYVKRRPREWSEGSPRIDPLQTKASRYVVDEIHRSLMHLITYGGEGHYGGKKTEKALVRIGKLLREHTRNMPEEKIQQFVNLVRRNIILSEYVNRSAYYRRDEGGERMVKEQVSAIAKVTDLARYVVIRDGAFPGWDSEEEDEEDGPASDLDSDDDV